MWFARPAWPGIGRHGKSFRNGSGGPPCSSPTPMQIAGRLSMKKLIQWSGETTIITSGLARLRRAPSASNAAVRRCLCAGVTACQSRWISGPWLAAMTSTSSAMRGFRLRRAGAEALDELVVLHARGAEIETQQVGVHAPGEEGHVVAQQRLLHLGLERVTREKFRAVGAVFDRVRLDVVEQLAEPIVAHAHIMARRRPA